MTYSSRANIEAFEKSPIEIGVLQAATPLRKREISKGKLTANPNVFWFTGLEQVEVEDIHDLGEGLSDLIGNPYVSLTTARLSPAGEKALESTGRFRRKFTAEPKQGYPEPHVMASASRVLLIDIDGIVTDDEVWLEGPEAFSRRIVRDVLPERFHDVSYWVSYSSSTGIKQKDGKWIIGLHLVFVVDRPLEAKKRQALVQLDAPEASPDNGKIDVSTLRCTQMYFTACPEFIGKDPIPIRSATVVGSSDRIEIDDDLMERIRSRRLANVGRGKGTSGSLPPALGFDENIAQLGDGEGLDGFHRVLRDAIFAYCVEHGEGFDQETLKEMLRELIDNAPKNACRAVGDIENYKSDSYLDHSISGALVLLESRSLAPRAYALPKGTIEEAREELKRGVAYFERLATWEGPPEIFQVGPDEYEVSGPEIVGIQTPTGSGKTREAIALVQRLIALGKRPAYFAPTHALCEEVAELLRENGIAAEVYRGLSAKDPAGGKDEEGNPHFMCRDPQYAQLMRKAGLTLNQACQVCPYLGKCGYHQQMEKKKHVQCWVIPHALLGHQRPKHTIGPCDAVIIDEDPIGALVQGFGSKFDALAVKQLQDESHEPNTGVQWQRQRLAKMVERGEFQPGRFGQTRKIVKWLNQTSTDLKREMPKGTEDRKTLAREIIALRYEAMVWQAIGERGVGLRIDRDADDKHALRTFRVRKVRKDWQQPTLILDATPEWEVYKQFFRFTKTFKIECDMPYVDTAQALFSAAKSKLGENQTGRNNLKKLQQFVEAQSYGAREVLVVAQMSITEKLEELGLPSNVSTAHFNALRGLDGWKNVDLLIVIGRAEPPPGELELVAEAVFQQRIEALRDGEYYPRRSVGLCERSSANETHAVHVSCHPDPRVEAFRKRAVDNELIQAVGRGRGALRTEANPLRVVLVNEVPIPLAIDRVVEWRNAQPVADELIPARFGFEIENPRARGAAKLIESLILDAPSSPSSQARGRSRRQTSIKITIKAFDAVSNFDRRGQLLVAGSRYSVPIRFRHGVWRQVTKGEQIPKRSIRRQILEDFTRLFPLGCTRKCRRLISLSDD